MSIVAVGSSCIDEILFVNEYPQEDRKIRSNGREIRRGGNAANTSEVLSRLGNKSIHFVGTIGAAKYIVKTQEEQKQHIVLDSLSSCHVSTFGCHHVPESLHNIATIILSQSNASRTVVSTNELRELYFQEFLISLLKIQSENDPTLDVSNLNIQELQSLMLQKDMSKIQWIHFEGRNNVIEMRKMMEWIINVNEKSLVNHKIRMSLEIETRRAGDLTTLISYLDYIFFSYDFSKICGFEDVSEFLLHQQKSAPKHSFLVCTMGSKGAQGIQVETGEIFKSDSFPPEQVIDTIGAGDTFNAAMIDSLCKGLNFQESLIRSCKIAGFKCGFSGFQKLDKFKSLE